MTVPSVLSRTSSVFTSSTTHLVSCPATTAVNDLLLSFFTLNSSAGTFTTPTGFSVICARATPGLSHAGAIYGKKADGTEGGTTVDHATSTAAAAGAWMYRFDAATWSQSISDVIGATSLTGISGQPNSGSVAWGWGALDELILTVAHCSSGTVTLTSYPTNYINGNEVHQATTLVGSVAIAERALTATASPEDPGAFVYSTNLSFVANTVVIKGSTGSVMPIFMNQYRQRRNHHAVSKNEHSGAFDRRSLHRQDRRYNSEGGSYSYFGKIDADGRQCRRSYART